MPSNFQLFIFPSQNGLGLKNFLKQILFLSNFCMHKQMKK